MTAGPIYLEEIRSLGPAGNVTGRVSMGNVHQMGERSPQERELIAEALCIIDRRTGRYTMPADVQRLQLTFRLAGGGAWIRYRAEKVDGGIRETLKHPDTRTIPGLDLVHETTGKSWRPAFFASEPADGKEPLAMTQCRNVLRRWARPAGPAEGAAIIERAQPMPTLITPDGWDPSAEEIRLMGRVGQVITI